MSVETTTAQTAAYTLVSTPLEVTQSVTKNGVTTREAVGNIDIHVPTLINLVTGAEFAEGVFIEGNVPAYTDEKHNFIAKALLAQVKAVARNRLVPKTVTLKDGLTIPKNWDELLAESTGGGGVYFALEREVKELFSQWVATLGKSTEVQARITKAFGNVEALRAASQGVKSKLIGYFLDFTESLGDDLTVKYTRYLDKVIEAANDVELSEDDL